MTKIFAASKVPKALFITLCTMTHLTAHAGLFGPSGSDNDCTARRSFAWCLLDLANRAHGIHDVSAGQTPVSNEPSELARTIDVVGGSALAIAGVADIARISNISGLGTFGGVMNILSGFKSMGMEPGSYPILVAFVDSRESSPKALLSRELIEATRKSLGAERFEYFPEDDGHAAVKRMGTGYYKFSGGTICEKKSCMAYTTADSKNYGPRVKKVAIPEWYPGDKNAVVMESPFPVWVVIDGTPVPNTATALSLARSLPQWIYVYAPSNPVTKSAVLLSNSKIYFFVEPQ